MNKEDKGKLIQFDQDAGFFFRVGMKYGNRKMYDIALKYFRKACEMEPFNPDYQFNLACILAELREIKESNKIMINILKNIDPTLTDCYFGLGCNYFDLGNTNKARDYFEKYIRYAPDGQFAAETEDILYYLDIYDGGERPGKGKNTVRKHMEDARKLIDEGQYEKACEKLEKIVEAEPQYTTARNRLSAAYLLAGDAWKAVIFANSALKLDPGDIDAHCNLALAYSQLGEFEEYKAELTMLTTLEPEKHEDFIRLVNLCISLGEHLTVAELLLERLKRFKAGIYYHLLATAFHNLGKYDEAFDIWEQASCILPHYRLLFDYCVRVSRQMAQTNSGNRTMDYMEHLPRATEAEISRKLQPYMEMDSEAFAGELREDKDLRGIVGYCLYSGTMKEWNKLVKKVLGSADPEFIGFIESMSCDETVSGENRKALRDMLGKMADAGRQEMFEADGAIYGVENWNAEWDDVLDCALQNKERSYKESYRLEIKAIWMNFITRRSPEKLPIIRKREAWAAALEYIYCSRNLISVTKSKLARKYNISPSSITSILKNMEG